MARTGYLRIFYFPPLDEFNQELIEQLYPRVRAGDKAAIDRMITLYIRLGISRVTAILPRIGFNQHDAAEMVSVACLEITEAVHRMSKGSIDHHNPANPTSYISVCVDGKITKFWHKNRLLHVDPKTFKKLQEKGRPFSGMILLDGLEKPYVPSVLKVKELMEVIETCIRSDLERQVVNGLMEGRTQREIASTIIAPSGNEYTEARIGQVAKGIAERVRHKLG
jgi:hypothetical protein